MSDTQNDTDPQPSSGRWYVSTREHCQVLTEDTGESGLKICSVTDYARRSDGVQKANAKLIAAAGNSAHEAAEMGYDSQKAVEALPKLLGALRSIAAAGHAPHDVVQKANRALESAEGSGDD